MTKIVVTGCNGQVGRAVVRLALKIGYQVVGIDIKASDDPISQLSAFYEVDLTDYEKVLEILRRENEVNGIKVDGLVHLGAMLPKGKDKEAAAIHNINVVASYNAMRACAELKIYRVAQASSVNIVPLVFSQNVNMKFDFFPLNESHHNEVDEPYGLSKVICELQARSLCRRYPPLRIASLRLHWVTSSITANPPREEIDRKDLWGWVHEDESARAFLLALELGSLDDQQDPTSSVTKELLDHDPGVRGTGWNGHEAFFIVAPTTRAVGEDSRTLKEKYYSEVVLEDGAEISGKTGFFNCSKAKKVLGWVHRMKSE